MLYFQWSPEYSVEVAELDQQHKQLLAMMNNAYAETEKDATPLDVSRMIFEMNEYAIAHFSREEKYMKQTAYAGYEDHKGQHEYFYDQIARFKAELATGNREIYGEIADFLKTWFFDHIVKKDQLYTGHFHDAGIR